MVNFEISYHGSIVLLTPRTDEAKAWCDNNLPLDAQRLADSYAVEPRYFDAIHDGIAEAGLFAPEQVAA